MNYITFNELVVESKYLLKLQSGNITKIPRLVTAKCPSSSDVTLSVTVFESPDPLGSFSAAPYSVSSIGGEVPLLRGRDRREGRGKGRGRERGGKGRGKIRVVHGSIFVTQPNPLQVKKLDPTRPNPILTVID